MVRFDRLRPVRLAPVPAKREKEEWYFLYIRAISLNLGVCLDSEFFCRCRVTSLAMAKRRAEILAEQPNGFSHLHPDLLVMKKNQAEVKQLKNSLLRTTIVIGDDDDYM
jgi:hypothetical protein